MMKAVALAIALAFCTINAASAQSTSAPYHYLSVAASTNSTLVFKPAGGNGVRLNGGWASNTNASTTYYLKFYSKATAPTCGTDPVLWTVPLPPNGVVVPLPDTSAIFPLGLGFCIVGGLPDNDSSVSAANIVVNLAVSGR